MFYQKIGQGQPLVLLHSGGMAGEEWRPQIVELEKRFLLLVPDLLGHGKSPMIAPRLSVEDMGRAVIEMLDKEGITQAHCCGSSMGGAVVLWLALNAPERVKTATIYRISYRKNTATHDQTKQMANPAYWQQYGLQRWLSQLHEPQGGEAAWQEVITRVSDALNPQTSAHNHELSRLAEIRCPVLLVVGDRDPVAPLDEVLAMYRTIPNAALWVMPFATHITASNTWRAKAFAEELKRFISR